MSEDAVKLTSYFGERRRVAGNGFAADALLDLYGRHEVATSILLRGAEGFGAKRHPRTDRSLTLSEDLPLTAVAVDTRTRIEPLVDATARITGTGLVTLERARLLRGDAATGEVEPVTLLDEVHEETKLTIYLGRQERVYRCRLSWPCATCCTGAASPGRPRCSASTGPRTGSASGPRSSAATPGRR